MNAKDRAALERMHDNAHRVAKNVERAVRDAMITVILRPASLTDEEKRAVQRARELLVDRGYAYWEGETLMFRPVTADFKPRVDVGGNS